MTYLLPNLRLKEVGIFLPFSTSMDQWSQS